MNPISVLLIALGLFAAGYLYVFVAGLVRDARDGQPLAPKPLMALISFIANFFDTLGVGSYATTTSMVRFFKLIPDEKIPGSLNVGYVIPTMIQAYVTIHGVSGLGVTVPPVEVDPLTLISLIAAAILGAWLGAGVVSSWPRRKIQLGMGLCLAAAAIIMLVRLTVFHSLEVGSHRSHRHQVGHRHRRLVRAWRAHDARHRSLRTVSDSRDAARHERQVRVSDHDGRVRVPDAGGRDSVHPRASVLRAGDARRWRLPGMLAVPLAFKWFQNLDMKWVKIVVIFVVAYASITMLLTAYRERGTAAAIADSVVRGRAAA